MLETSAMEIQCASMRPRPSCRGEPADWPTVRRHCVASMRPRPSCRGELREPSGRGRMSPSMRPRPSCRGERREHGRPPETAVASMRPRPSCRGERFASAGRPAADRASMRPRPSCRGEPPPAPPVVKRRHWTFNAATAFVPWRTLTVADAGAASVALQCGHGLRAVENPKDSLDPCRSVRRFNAATAFVPWRTRRLALGNVAYAVLQCGHGLRAVENAEPTDASRRVTQPSMRPRPSCRGERSCAISAPSAGFNAATAFVPWRTRYAR